MKNKLYLITPVILVLVFIHQFYLVQTKDLTQWKGGGFGMFSTIDSVTEREVRVFLNTENDTIPIIFPFSEEFNLDLRKAKIIPSKDHLNVVFKHIKKEDWYCNYFEENNNPSCILATNLKQESSIKIDSYYSITIRTDKIIYNARKNSLDYSTISKFIFER